MFLSSTVHRQLAHPVVHHMSLHPDYHQWATGGPPDVATSSGPPDVALVVGTLMLACGCIADADMKWPTACTYPVVHWMCPPDAAHSVDHLGHISRCMRMWHPVVHWWATSGPPDVKVACIVLHGRSCWSSCSVPSAYPHRYFNL